MTQDTEWRDILDELSGAQTTAVPDQPTIEPLSDIFQSQEWSETFRETGPSGPRSENPNSVDRGLRGNCHRQDLGHPGRQATPGRGAMRDLDLEINGASQLVPEKEIERHLLGDQRQVQDLELVPDQVGIGYFYI